MRHDVLGLRVAVESVPQGREAVLEHVYELRALLAGQPPAVRRNLARCVSRAEESLMSGSPDAAAHLRQLHEAADFVSEMRSEDPTSLPLAFRARALKRDLDMPRLVAG
jgi:hypothetical protein